MTVKLNLTVDEKTASAIKKYAKRKNTSVSKIAEELFEKTIHDDKRKQEAEDFIEKYAGKIRVQAKDNLKEIITKAIEEKHASPSLS